MKCPECGKNVSNDVALDAHRKNTHGAVKSPTSADASKVGGDAPMVLPLAGGFLIFAGLIFVFGRKSMYYSATFMSKTVSEGKLSEHDALVAGVALLATGSVLIGAHALIVLLRKRN